MGMMVGIQARTGVDMDTEAVKTAWDMCRFEKAWHPFEQTLPGWCSIFSLEDLELLEWREDLKKYYSDGMGYDINTKMTQPLFQDIFSKIDTANGQIAHQESKVFLHFGHSSGVLPLISALELYNDDRDLLASDWSNDRRDHKWRISDIATFGANIGVALYQCYEDGGYEPSGIYNLISSGCELIYFPLVIP